MSVPVFRVFKAKFKWIFVLYNRRQGGHKTGVGGFLRLESSNFNSM